MAMFDYDDIVHDCLSQQDSQTIKKNWKILYIGKIIRHLQKPMRNKVVHVSNPTDQQKNESS